MLDYQSFVQLGREHHAMLHGSPQQDSSPVRGIGDEGEAPRLKEEVVEAEAGAPRALGVPLRTPNVGSSAASQMGMGGVFPLRKPPKELWLGDHVVGALPVEKLKSIVQEYRHEKVTRSRGQVCKLDPMIFLPLSRVKRAGGELQSQRELTCSHPENFSSIS